MERPVVVASAVPGYGSPGAYGSPNALPRYYQRKGHKHSGTGQHGPAAARFVAYCLSTEAAKDILGLVVVTGALLIYGLLQERIVTFGFGSNKEVFEHSIFLVLCNRFVTVTLAGMYLLATRSATAPAAPLTAYAGVSLTNVIATACQYEALRYVSFAVQTLAKSAKALPVMVWSTVYLRRRYRLQEYLHATTITLGCSVFILTGHVRSRVADRAAAHAAAAAAAGAGLHVSGDAALLVIGGGLMLLYLFVDGLTSTWQDSMFRGYSVNICDQVLYTASFSMLLSLIGCIATHQLLPALAFLARNPEAIWWILALSAASAAVQLVISWTIKRYGAVVFATIMTTRQFFSILLSSVVYLTPLTLGQWGGTLLVFGAIYVKALQRCSESKQLTAKQEDSPPDSSEQLPDVKSPLLDRLESSGVSVRHQGEERRQTQDHAV